MAMVNMDELFEELRQVQRCERQSCDSGWRRDKRLAERLVAQGTSEDSVDAEEIHRKDRKKKYMRDPHFSSREQRRAQYALDHEAAFHRLKRNQDKFHSYRSDKRNRKVADSDYDIQLDGFNFTTGTRLLQAEDLRKLFENVSIKENLGKS